MNDDYTISTDKSLLDLTVIHQFLSQESYWARNISVELVQKCIDNALCFGVYINGEQVGFARVISDCATMAYLSDVFIAPAHRGRGLSKKLVQHIIDYPELQGLRRWILVTQDAHTLYEQYGFTPLDEPGLYMHRKWNSHYGIANTDADKTNHSLP